MTQQEYWQEVRSLAESIFSESIKHPDAVDQAREDLEEYLWETIDGHEWVIYTHKAQQVLTHSPNDDYSLNFGVESIADESGIKWDSLAFGALYADVSDHLWPLFDEWEAELGKE